MGGRPGPRRRPPCPLLPPSGLSVPTEQRRWRDQESLPSVPRKEPAEGSQEGAVGPSVLDTAVKLALEGAHLVTQDHKLDVFVHLAPAGRGHERQDPAQPEVQKGEGLGP
jgi:hypothetical protein